MHPASESRYVNTRSIVSQTSKYVWTRCPVLIVSGRFPVPDGWSVSQKLPRTGNQLIAQCLISALAGQMAQSDSGWKFEQLEQADSSLYCRIVVIIFCFSNLAILEF